MKLLISNTKKSEWLNLPAEDDYIQGTIDLFGGDYFIENHKCQIDGIVNPDSDLFDLNELAYDIESLDQEEIKKVKFLMQNNHMSFSEAFENQDKVFIFLGDLKALAREKMEDHYWGKVTPNLVNFFDYERLGNELRHHGYVYDHAQHVTFRYDY